MHPTAQANAQRFLERYATELLRIDPQPRLLEIGSQDVNGSLRGLFGRFDYTGVDFAPGKGVDVVLDDPYTLPYADASADVVVASSVFEHSQLFWVLFLEILRVLKPTGLFYLNVPSNGQFHRHPVDCWRFYPDSGMALAAWAQRNGVPAVLLESYTSAQSGGEWNDFVGVFLKDGREAHRYPRRILDVKRDIFNGILHGRGTFLEPTKWSEDQIRRRRAETATATAEA
jgi:SAM-dependent methyltransferase